MSEMFYACEYSQQMNEALFPNAPRAEYWLLLEYPRAWSAQAYEDSSLSAEVKAHLDAQLARLPNARLQLIAHGHRDTLADLHLYVIRASWDAPFVRRFVLPTPEALLTLPLADIALGTVEQGELVHEPLYIVCTNGKRDVCCAVHGLPLYKALHRQVGAAVWESNHIGGHRFAGTLVSFPHGIYYGRLTVEDVPGFVEATQAGQLYSGHSRGRACVPPPAQAAELFLREQTGIQALDAFDVPLPSKEGDLWSVHIRERSSDRVYQVQIHETLTSFDVIADSQKPTGKPGPQFRLLAIE